MAMTMIKVLKDQLVWSTGCMSTHLNQVIVPLSQSASVIDPYGATPLIY